MAKDLTYNIVTDPSKGIAGLKQFSAAAKKAMQEVDDSMEDTSTNAQKVAKALGGLADDIEKEMKGAAAAAEALGQALGPELSGRANVDSVVQDLRKMGLSFDEITADADELAAALKKLDDVQMTGAQRGLDDMEQSTSRTKHGIDELAKSADSSKSVMANMVGNATQDVGALGGVAGSAGVAIGQMGEYMVDAAFSGDKFATVVANFAKVAGPIAAIATVLSVVQGVMASNEERAAAAAKATEDYGQAMQDSANDALGFADVMRGNIAEMQNFSGAATETGDILKDVASNVPVIGQLFEAPTVDVTEVFNEIQVGLVRLGRAIGGNVHDWNDLHAALAFAHKQGRITDTQLDQTTKFINEQRDAVKNAEEAQMFHNIAVGEANDLYDELMKKKNPLGELTEQWDILFEAIENGTLRSERATNALNLLHNELGLAPEDVLTTAIEGLEQKQQDAAEAAKEHTDALKDQHEEAKKLRDEMTKYKIAVSKADDELVNMSGSFEQMASAGDALSSIFDLKNASKDAQAEVRDIGLEIGKLSDIPVDVGAALKGKIKADDFLDAIDSLRPQIQSKITEAFSSGGPDAARATALQYIAAVTKELGGKFTPQQVAEMLGLADFEATIGLAIEQTAVDKAKRQLEVLVGVGGETPYTASIALALDAGEITGEQAQALIQPELDKAGVTIPSTLRVPMTQETLAEAQKKLDGGKPLGIPAVLTINEVTAIGGGKYRMKNGVIMQDAGGVTPFPGGIVAEKGAEIVRLPGQRRDMLALSPSYVPPGTRVTSRKRTDHILRTRGTRGLRKYDSGGVVPSSVTVNVSAGVIGNTYDMMNIVNDAARRAARLLPRHG